jgi:hypothetical protein
MSAHVIYKVVATTNAGITLNIISLVGGSILGGTNLAVVLTSTANGSISGGNTQPFTLGEATYPWINLNSTGLVTSNGDTITITIKDYTSGDGIDAYPTNFPNGALITVGAYIQPCFTESSKLLTPAGYVKASELRTGDILVTADGRQVPIKAYSSTIKADKMNAPYLIPKNSLARNVPAADLRLSPWHAIYLGDGLWQKPQTAAELNPGTLTQYDIGKDVTYYHFEAPNYFTDNFICDGTVVESFASKQVSEKEERPFKWSEKHQAYKRSVSKSAHAKA